MVFQRDEERTMLVHHPSAKPPVPLRLFLNIALSCAGVKALSQFALYHSLDHVIVNDAVLVLSSIYEAVGADLVNYAG